MTSPNSPQVRESDQTVLVTGAAGFVGGYVVKLLRDEGRKVRGMVHSEASAHALRSLGIPAVVADVRNASAVRQAMDGIHSVIHIAALFRAAGPAESVFREINATGTRIVFEEAERAGVKRVVHCSTVGVHGDIATPPGTEISPFAPGDPYQRTKLEGEMIAREFFARGGVSGVVIRPAMVYGPGDIRTLKLFSLIAKQRFAYVGAGDAFVHFVDVRDLARAFVQGLDAERLNNEVFIIAGERAVRFKELATLIAATLRVSPPRLHLPVKPMQLLGSVCEAVCMPLQIEPPIFRRRVDFFTKNRIFDTAKAQSLLHFRPERGWEEEVKDIVGWYLTRGFISSPHVEVPSKSSSRHNSLAPIDFASPNRQIMVRSLEGNIYFWNSGAERYYGFRQKEAVGHVSHELLRTEFSSPLEEINERVLQGSIWEGSLLHTRRDGKRVKVMSQWSLGRDPESAVSYVIEVNHDGSTPSGRFPSCSAAAMPMLEYFSSNAPIWAVAM